MSKFFLVRGGRLVCILVLFAASIASSQVQKSALIDSLKGLEATSIVTIGYTGSASNQGSYPVNTLVYPDGKIIYRVESGMLRMEVKQMQSFLIGTRFQISGVDFKQDRLELKLTIPNRDEARLKMMLGAGWQNQMTNDAVIALISKFLSLPPAPIVLSAAGTAPTSSVPSASQVLDKSLPLTAPDSAQRVGGPSNEDERNRERAPDLRTTSAAPSSASSGSPGSLPISQPPDIVPQRGASLDWDKKRAADGDAEGEMALGTRYLTGDGVSKNEATAEAWFRKAADQGKPIAQNNLGTFYMRPDGLVPGTYIATGSYWPSEAMRWYLKAADQGDAAGEFNVGNAYEKGLIVKEDLQQARSWYQKAAQQGQGDAKAALERLDAIERSERLAYEEKSRERRVAEEGERRVAVEDRRRSRIAMSLGLYAGQPQAQVKVILAAHGYSGFTGSGPWTCVPNGVVNGEDTVGCASRSDQVAKLIVVFGMAKRYRNPDTTELYGVRTDRLLVAYFEFAESKFFRSSTLNFYSAELRKCNGVNNDDNGCLNF